MNNTMLEEIKKIFITLQTKPPKEWLSLKEAAEYAGVSYNTFIKFREMGLRVAEVEGVKRVSCKEIDKFYENHSF
ncbi:helix-turn-helix domain-containing protein [Kurthia gibsonii]|uniref:Helix-turn-helix domain-containing protein n=1 Tax=Kurthia gibsonii TaxID=33946 RepID=A0ABU9LKH8_9BACL|nr:MULTISPECIES: helix-turn-helix domain-containing protein [Kurthia]AMA64235.1 helix-turn-helix domain protein [Kurthia sp. 11kri321]MEB6113343.1 helix-turn-helix domain-containing protein [Kurthia gibsonii]HZG13255.1 helix-turn-helix domain-containing protein [Kurthia gibsonii]